MKLHGSDHLPVHLKLGSTDADIRHAVAHADLYEEARPFVVKVVAGILERPDLIPLEWPERSVTPITAGGRSWLLPDTDGNVNQPQTAYTSDPFVHQPITGSIGESAADAIRAMNAMAAAVPGEIARLVLSDQAEQDAQDELERRRAIRRARVHGSDAKRAAK